MKSEVTWGDMGTPSATRDAIIQNNPTPHCRERRLAKYLPSKEERRIETTLENHSLQSGRKHQGFEAVNSLGSQP